MKRLMAYLLIIFAVALLELSCLGLVKAQTPSNAIKMGYNFVTVSQTVVFNSAMQAGGTFTLSTQAMEVASRYPKSSPAIISHLSRLISKSVIHSSRKFQILPSNIEKSASYS